MSKNKKGYITLVLLILIAFGFVLSGGLILSNQFSLNTEGVESTDQYLLVDSQNFPSHPTLQLSTLSFTSQVCGLGGFDIALVIDNSSSINASELTQMKNAMIAFTTALSGTSTQFSVIRFATTAEVVQPFTNNISQVNNAISSITGGGSTGGSTNWQDGLVKAQSTFPNRSNSDLIIFASDGNPNRTGTSGDHVNESVAVADAVVIANAIKTGGAKILALGIGDQLNTKNLQSISGPKVGTDLNADVIISDFDTLAADLAAFTANTCVVGQEE